MRIGRHFVSVAYTCVWAVLLFWFAARDIPNLCRDLRDRRTTEATPNASTNSFLGYMLRVPEATERFNAMFARLPASAPVIFVSPKHDDRWGFVYYAVSYLAWPRKIDRVELDAHERFKPEHSAQAAIIFCGIPPSVDSPNRWTIGPNMIVIRPAE